MCRAARIVQRVDDEPIDADSWQDNLDKPVDDGRDHGAHGIFGDQARTTSPQLWLATHKPQVSAVAGGLAAVAGLFALGRRDG